MRHEVTMGQICSSTNNNKGGARPPRDLALLLEELVEAQEKEQEQPYVWGQLFVQFLKHRDQVFLLPKYH